MQSKSYAGKVAAITGAGSGIGRALAVALAREGCALALSDVDEPGLAATAAAVGGVPVIRSRVDVSRRDEVDAWAEEVVREFGRVNLVFNNAGIAFGGTVQGTGPEDFERVMAVDFWGVVHGTQAFLPHLEASGDGHVVNVSSLFGLIAFPGQSAYNAAKFAVRGFTDALRIELEITGSVVSATCVHPGGVRTNIARASRVDPSLASLGVDVNTFQDDFERLLRLTPEAAADVILRGVRRDARRVVVGADARWLDRLQRLFPGSYHRVLVRWVRAATRRRGARAR